MVTEFLSTLTTSMAEDVDPAVSGVIGTTVPVALALFAIIFGISIIPFVLYAVLKK